MGEWIANIALYTGTNWNVILNFALSIYTAKTRAWILAFSIDTCSVCRTVGIDITLRSAVRR